jgi:RimJ/RimL family protein N-acetyltransferase
MKVYTDLNIDLIEPFPEKEIPRMVGWLHCYKSIIHSDDSPQTDEELIKYFTDYFRQPNVRSWGIIDKNHKVNIQHDAPLVGFGAFEFAGAPGSARNGYFHCATTRKAWGSGLINEAYRLAVNTVFLEHPSLLRVSSFVINNNYPARKLALSVGMKVEGVMHDAVLQQGIPKPLSHFGMTRRDWMHRIEMEAFRKDTSSDVQDASTGRVAPSEAIASV